MRIYALIFAVFICFCIFALICGCAGKPAGQPEAVAHEQFFNYTVHFCAEEDCTQAIKTQLLAAEKSVDCALYGISDGLLSGLAQRQDITTKIVVDNNAAVAGKYVESGLVYKYKGTGIMHNKYCVIDNRTILTGSFNPTLASKGDYNNLLIINSTALAAFYQNDFQGLYLHHRRLAAVNKVMLNTTLIEAYFCPSDNCAAALIGKLRKANNSIVFAAYSFTSPGIANELVVKLSEGINISGIIEKSTTGSKYSKHDVLAANGISLAIESSKKLMHHKFFVIDDSVVITGSFNPTENADTKNAENLIFVRSPELAEKYTNEFNSIYQNTSS